MIGSQPARTMSRTAAAPRPATFRIGTGPMVLPPLDHHACGPASVARGRGRRQGNAYFAPPGRARETRPVSAGGVATAGDAPGDRDAGVKPGVDPAAPATEPQPASSSPGGRGLLAALLVAVNLPILVATTRALGHGWQPLGDNGILLVRARDVGTSHHPLLGTWTSASVVVGHQVNNPGPLYFDAVAPAVRLLGPWVGLAVGVMLVNMAASSLAVVMGRRISGTESMVAVAVVVVALQFALGSELLFDIWQPNALVLPFFAFLVVAAVLVTGRLWMVPWLIGLGSLIVQTHLSHAVLVVLVTLTAGALAAANLRIRREWPEWRGPLLWTVVVAALAWIQPLVDQFWGEGNLTTLAGASGGGGSARFGISRASRIVAHVVTGPWFTRESYAHGVPLVGAGDPLKAMPSFPVAVAIVAVVVAVLAGLAVWAWLAGHRPLATMLALAAVTQGGAVVALATSPLNILGIAPHQMRWLCPVAGLGTPAALTAGLTALRARPALARPALLAGAALVAVVALVNLPTYVNPSPGPTMVASRLPQARELVNQLGVLKGKGPIRYDPRGLIFAEPYSGLEFAQMQHLDIPFVFTDPTYLRQLGTGRRDHGQARWVLNQVEGPKALTTPDGAQRV